MKSLKKLLPKVASFLLQILDDILILAGIALMAKGVFMIHIPAGYITLGLCAMVLAYLVAKRG